MDGTAAWETHRSVVSTARMPEVVHYGLNSFHYGLRTHGPCFPTRPVRAIGSFVSVAMPVRSCLLSASNFPVML